MFTGNPQITHSELEIQVLSMTAGLHFQLIPAFLSLHNGNTETPLKVCVCVCACARTCVCSESDKAKERKCVAAHFSLHPKRFLIFYSEPYYL